VTTLEIVHETRYAYAAPVALAHHLAHLQPLNDGFQELLAHELVTEPGGETRHAGVDTFGNPCLWFSRALPHDHLLVRTCSRVRVRPRFDGHPLAEIPTDRPVLFLANHPFGVIDGLTLGCLATNVRPDLKIMTHSMLCQVPEARPYLLPVDFDRSAAARLTTVRTRQRAIEWLTDGHAVGIFPGGGIATAGRPLRGPALEHPWHVFVARLLAVPDLLVVPVFFHGQNSRLFQVASHLNYPLRVALIFHETRRRMGRDLRVTIGTPFRADSLPKTDRAEALDDLRRRTLALGNARPEVLANTFRFRDWIEVD